MNAWFLSHTHLQPRCASQQFLQECVIDSLVDNHSRAGRAFLAAEAEGGSEHALDGRIQIGLRIHDDGVFAPHLRHHALNPNLSR